MTLKTQQHEEIEILHDYNILLNTREIFTYGDVDPYGELGAQFIKNLNYLTSKSKDKPIIVHNHSNGGDWACGIMIFDAIVNSSCPIIMVCHGIIASMGTVIAMACHQHGNSYVINMPNCDWMIHEGFSGIGEGFTSKRARAWMNWENKMSKQMWDYYADAGYGADKFEGKTRSQVKAFIKRKIGDTEDWILNGRECVEYGFAHAVLGDENFETLDVIKGHWQ